MASKSRRDFQADIGWSTILAKEWSQAVISDPDPIRKGKTRSNQRIESEDRIRGSNQRIESEDRIRGSNQRIESEDRIRSNESSRTVRFMAKTALEMCFAPVKKPSAHRRASIRSLRVRVRRSSSPIFGQGPRDGGPDASRWNHCTLGCRREAGHRHESDRSRCLEGSVFSLNEAVERPAKAGVDIGLHAAAIRGTRIEALQPIRQETLRGRRGLFGAGMVGGLLSATTSHQTTSHQTTSHQTTSHQTTRARSPSATISKARLPKDHLAVLRPLTRRQWLCRAFHLCRQGRTAADRGFVKTIEERPSRHCKVLWRDSMTATAETESDRDFADRMSWASFAG